METKPAKKVRVSMLRAKHQLQPGRIYNLDRAIAAKLIASGHAARAFAPAEIPRPPAVQQMQTPPAVQPIQRPLEPSPAAYPVQPLATKRKGQKKAKP
jgi:hypothetical protein